MFAMYCIAFNIFNRIECINHTLECRYRGRQRELQGTRHLWSLKNYLALTEESISRMFQIVDEKENWDLYNFFFLPQYLKCETLKQVAQIGLL